MQRNSKIQNASQPGEWARRWLRSVPARALGVWIACFLTGLTESAAQGIDRSLEEKIAGLFDALPPIQRHYEGITEAAVAARRRQELDYQALIREKIQDQWFAALIATPSGGASAIQGRFQTWKGLADFIVDRQALVELWAYGEGGMENARRIPATEVAALRQQRHEQPLFVTLTYREPIGGAVVTQRVEFGLSAARMALTAQRAYRHQRDLQAVVREVLGARDNRGRLSAWAQWHALRQAVEQGRLVIREMPHVPFDPDELYVAFEYEVDGGNHFTHAVRIWRANEMQKQILQDSPGHYRQALRLNAVGETPPRDVLGYRIRGMSDELELVPNPVPGHDFLELRIRNPDAPDPRQWNVLEFGEPEIVRQSALAQFSLVSAHLDKRRKEIALRKSRLDLFTEPIFAGLNIGGGLTAVFPIGEAARLFYNATVAPRFIADVPSVKQMRELFQLVAAKNKDPELKLKPARFLDKADLKRLEKAAQNLTEDEVRDFLQRISDDDLAAMLRLAAMKRIDERVTNLLSIIAGAGKVSGWTDEPGAQRAIFNNIYVSVTGEISIDNIIAVLAGAEEATPKSGVSLYDLSRGEGPAVAWLQYFNVTVDIRALLNSISRLFRKDFADKELKMPVPYAPRLSDLSAYEFRIFGYPLLIYHKRGLLKADYAAFTNDFAYGFIGAKLVEHFQTRGEMDAEIRAGRMVPLGYVRVPDGKGGRKESNLAVFAHRIPAGKHKGKTALVIYGLSAYTEHLQLIEREYQRFQQFEQALKEGGVIEQVVDAENRGQLPSTAFEPVWHVGPQAGSKLFAPLLGRLLEWRRHLQRDALGLTRPEDRSPGLAALRQELEAWHIRLEDPEVDPLVGVDPYSSSFSYRKQVDGQWQIIKLTYVPGQADLERGLAKAEEAGRIEQMQREAISSQGNGLALIHTVRNVDGRDEMGPLRQDAKGDAIAGGVRVGAGDIARLLDAMNLQTIPDRARLRFNDYASTLVEIAVDPGAPPEKVFVSFEFPIDKRLAYDRISSISGQPEVLTFYNGQWLSAVTDRRLQELDYDDTGQERSSRTYLNAGTRAQPVKGALLEETRTLEVWFRDRRSGAPDPYLPSLSKMSANRITGEIVRQTYGLFPLPVTVLDDRFVSQARFNDYGVFASSAVHENGITEEDFQRPLRAKLLQPIPGRPRFRLVSTLAPPELARLRQTAAQGFTTIVNRTDLIQGLARTLVFDDARNGRLIRESYMDSFDGSATFPVETVSEFRDDFFFGMIPFKTTSRSGVTAAELSVTTTADYEPLARRLTAVAVDHSGQMRTNVWDYRWENPVEIATPQRLTTNQFNRAETSVTGTTVARGSGEEIIQWKGEFEGNSQRWRLDHVYWFRPGLTNRIETEIRSGYGKLILTSIGDTFEVRPVYDPTGIARAHRVTRRNSTTGEFDLLHQVSDDFQWRQGQCDARVQTFVEDAVHDQFRRITDSAGRTAVDGIRQWPGFISRTIVTHDGESDRIERTEEWHNAAVRVVRRSQQERSQPDGAWSVPVIVTPQWGLVTTQTFLMGDPLGRPVSTTSEDGTSVEVRDWFPGSAVARVAEVIGRQGQPTERIIKTLNTGTHETMPLDRTTHYKLSFWGTAGLVRQTAWIRGTEAALFTDAADERTYFNPAATHPSPWYAVDRQGQHGVPMTIGTSRRTNVMAVFDSRLVAGQPGGQTNQASTHVITRIDLSGLLSQRVLRQTLDRSGRILEDTLGRIPNLGDPGYTPPSIFQTPVTRMQQFRYHYQPGWFVEQPDRRTGARMLVFTEQPPPPAQRSFSVNDGPSPEMVTQVEGVQWMTESSPSPVEPSSFPFRRLHAPRQLERNPHLPDCSDVWTSWTTTERGVDGRDLFQVETIHNAQGRASVVHAAKSTRTGQPGGKISYHIPEPDPAVLQEHSLAAGLQTMPMDLRGRQDLSGSDFIYFYQTGAGHGVLTITDNSKRQITVRPGDSRWQRGEVSPWLIEARNVRWLPHSVQPRYGIQVTAPGSLLQQTQVLAVSIHDLDRAGLDVRQVASFLLQISNAAPHRVRISPIHVLERGGDFIRDEEPQQFSYSKQTHSSGLSTLIVAEQGREEREVYAGQRMNALVTFNGLPVAAGSARSPLAHFPHLTWLDNSDVDAPRPLYAISPRDGRLLEHYRVINRGDSQVYSVVQGFSVPRLEIYRAGIMEDELNPGMIAYGKDYRFAVQTHRSRNPLGKADAWFRGRMEANAFKFSGDWMVRRLHDDWATGGPVKYFDYASLQEAGAQARQINQLPMLAQALLPTRALPWPLEPQVAPTPLTVDWTKLRFALGKLHLVYPTGLIPTSPDTAGARYVDTVEEADLIILAVKLGENGLARELLDFYWLKSQGGQLALHASYDAQAGTSMKMEALYARPLQARRTSEAQLAIADAAFHLGFATSDAQWLTLGRNLIEVVLRDFRPPPAKAGEPRGIADNQERPARNVLGFSLWPDPDNYSLRSNARAYLLFRRLLPLIEPRFSDPSWRLEIAQALQETESFLKTFVLPQVERTGVVSAGLFEIQDIHQETTALAVDRWTSAQDWLSFLEVVVPMGVPPATARNWLENLARVHGVRVHDNWGLDWRIPLLRPDAISSELTAKFLRVADQLGHTQAVAFADSNLAALQQAGEFPVVLTEAPPVRTLAAGQDFTIRPATNQQQWPNSLTIYRELQERLRPGWDLSRTEPSLATRTVAEAWPVQRTDLTVFILITAGFYLSILASAIFWWSFRALRKSQPPRPPTDPLVSEGLMRRAEERWAKRVLGVQSPENAEKWRFSNAPVEHNFLMQLRAIYKLVLEWRREENGWSEEDPRLADDASDGWLNGADEYATVVGIYMRWVIKAGVKDGFNRDDVLSENEDSNHIWARLTVYFSEHLWGLLALVNEFQNVVAEVKRDEIREKIEAYLNEMGLRRRSKSFDARWLLNFPVNPDALDLLVIQKPETTLPQLLLTTAIKLNIPYEHLVRVIGQYKAFKKREGLYPIHPHVIELARMLPHFVLMGLGAIIWYNQGIGDSPIVPYLRSIVTQFALSPQSLTWAVPLFGGFLLTVAAHFVRTYRFHAPIRPREKAGMILDATLTSFFAKDHTITSRTKDDRWWNPELYEWCGWGLRALGCAWLGFTLLQLETPSFGTFLIVKGLLAMLAFAEVAGLVLPMVGTVVSKFLQDWVIRHPDSGPVVRFANRLNISATQPTSPIWLSIKYHFQPSVPTGSAGELAQAVGFYFILAATFFFVGGFLCHQIFSLWISDTYLGAADWKLFLGSLVFWNTMFLLRYGLFLLFTGVASMLATFPVKVLLGLAALAQLAFVPFSPMLGLDANDVRPLAYSFTALGLGLMLFENRVWAWLRGNRTESQAAAEAETRRKVEQIRADRSATLGVVYMSGDALAAEKLTPTLLMSRWELLRDKLDSPGLRVLENLAERPDDTTLKRCFQELSDAEQRCDVTLWHPLQVCLAKDEAERIAAAEAGDGAAPAPCLPPELGLNIIVESEAKRQQLLTAWHLRRWLTCMMSTAGHSQDTAVNLVDIALRLKQEGLSANTVFYLAQNKYDAREDNRPVQGAYARGELGQRNKLARLLEAVAPGARAYCVQNWTPFGFKAGGLTGMDLVYEKSLDLTTLLLLDRNATVQDLDALMLDLRQALTDPDLVIVIPGRSTTNTLTPLGQASQMVEEGHRSFLKGLMAFMGGGAGESVGTGWGNILACHYGRVQHALVDPYSRKMPLSTRLRRGTSFADRTEGLIGFGPHAVGISEDIWAVVQSMNNAIAFGRRPRFALSRAIWHKIRETWSHTEWLASFPRWSGGFFQMMHDPLMQRINDFGAQSVFVRDVRANSGRNFLSAPLAVLSILWMPLAIMLDVTPFVQILLVLWNFGFVMNQVLTLHALNTYLESSGFYRIPAVVGALAAGVWCEWMTTWQPYAPGLVLMGFLAGGFHVGLSRWFYTRVRDLILFGPQLVLHSLGQVVRQSLEFVVSGASPEDAQRVNMAFRAWVGPREDRPGEAYASLINMRTVIWIVGLPSLVLSAFALSNLDLLNVLLLLPSLLFTVSTLVGPFLMKPSVGRPLGLRVVIPKLLGWLVALTFYTGVSLLVAQGGLLGWIGVALFALVFLVVLSRALRYVTFRFRQKRLRRALVELLAAAGSEKEAACSLADRILQQCSTPAPQVATELERAKIKAEHQEPILRLATEKISPLLLGPALEGTREPWANNRWLSEWARSFVLALFVLFWLFIVPVPGLIVFKAVDYQLTIGFETICLGLGGILALVIGGAWIGRFIQWLDHGAPGHAGLKQRLEQAFRRLQGRAGSSGSPTALEIAQVYALLTDAQTYLDQRSYAYARATLESIERILGASAAGDPADRSVRAEG